jgi:hypothetical protein
MSTPRCAKTNETLSIKGKRYSLQENDCNAGNYGSAAVAEAWREQFAEVIEKNARKEALISLHLPVAFKDQEPPSTDI